MPSFEVLLMFRIHIDSEQFRNLAGLLIWIWCYIGKSVTQLHTRFTYFGFKSKIKPKKPYIEVNAMKERLNDAISALTEINRASSKVLFMRSDQGKYVSRNDLAEELRIKPSTVSYYLSLIGRVLGDMGGKEVLRTKKIGRTKYWLVDEKYGGMIRDREDDFSGLGKYQYTDNGNQKKGNSNPNRDFFSTPNLVIREFNKWMVKVKCSQQVPPNRR